MTDITQEATEQLVRCLSDVAAMPGPNPDWPSMLPAVIEQMRYVARGGVVSSRADVIALARIDAVVAGVAEAVAHSIEEDDR
jgi:hypothetical protein